MPLEIAVQTGSEGEGKGKGAGAMRLDGDASAIEARQGITGGPSGRR
jgi:hypothetical protein